MISQIMRSVDIIRGCAQTERLYVNFRGQWLRTIFEICEERLGENNIVKISKLLANSLDRTVCWRKTLGDREENCIGVQV